jgi:hypothetical protein
MGMHDRRVKILALLLFAAFVGGALLRFPLSATAQETHSGAKNLVSALTPRLPQPLSDFTNRIFSIFSNGKVFKQISPAAQKIIETAEREVGVFENETVKGLSSCTKLDTNRGTRVCQPSGSIGSVNQYLASVPIPPGSLWCMSFVNWVFETAGYPLPLQTGCVDRFVVYADAQGWSVQRQCPEPGDVVVFQYGVDEHDCYAAGGSDFDHAGIVTKVYSDCSYDTVEGNVDNQVSRRHYTKGQEVVRFIAVPGVTSKGSIDGSIGGGGGGTSGTGKQSHTACRDNRCVMVPGAGINECDSNAECRSSHRACRGYQCVVVPEPGKDECTTNADCESPTIQGSHRTCVNLGLGPQCTVIAGRGTDACSTDIDCPSERDRPDSGSGGGIIGPGDPNVCAPGTRLIGQVEGWDDGVRKTITLCAIPNIRSTGLESTPGSKYYIPGANGDGLANASASANFFGLGEACPGLVASSTYRTYEHQEYLYNCYLAGQCNNLAAPPGYSNHQMGYAFDFSTVNDCLRNNASRFGLYAKVEGENWHYSLNGF